MRTLRNAVNWIWFQVKKLFCKVKKLFCKQERKEMAFRSVKKVIATVLHTQECPIKEEQRKRWCKEWNCSRWDSCLVR